MKTRVFVLAALAASSVSGIAMAAGTASIETSPQPAGDEITVDSVTSNGPGFVVIHASDAEGKPIAPQSIGHQQVEDGQQQDVEVSLDEETQSGDKVFVMLHEDTGEEGEYEFGPGSTDVDPPMTADGKPVVVPMDIE
ncbi:hypothetical protein [Halomonas sp. M20]|uniref:DUF7282 domain-containing protein n=1 Tax=Halomonas sp. M20 TaxID=2763264 RepID=UPI001D0A1EA1|nr:hypothetical protein [Halomonas sp. M20]